MNKIQIIISRKKINTGIRTTYTIKGLNFTIVKPFSTSNNKLAPENGNEGNSEGNNSNSNNYNPTDNSNNSPSSPQEVSDNHAHTSNSPRSSEGDGYETDSNRSLYEEGIDAMTDHPVRDLPDDHLRRYTKDTRHIKRNPEMAGIEGDDSEDERLRQFWGDRHEELRAELRRRKEEGEIPDSSSESEYSSSTSEYTDNQQDNVSNRPDSGTVPTDSGNNESGEGIASGGVSGTSSGIESSGANDTNASSSAQSTNKRKFEEDEESSTQPSKKLKYEESKKRKFEEDDESSTQPSKRFKQDSSEVTGDTEPFDFGGGDD